jgi:hypothetical protein
MDVAASWQSAQAALARRDMPEARRHLLAVLERQPAHAYARVMLAGTVLAQGQAPWMEPVEQVRQRRAGSGTGIDVGTIAGVVDEGAAAIARGRVGVVVGGVEVLAVEAVDRILIAQLQAGGQVQLVPAVAAGQLEALVAAAAAVIAAHAEAHLGAIQPLLQDDVDHAGDGAGAIDRRLVAGRDVDALDHRGGDAGQVDEIALAVVQQRVVGHGAAVDQDQGETRIQAQQADRLGSGGETAGELAVLHRAGGQRLRAQYLVDVLETLFLDVLRADRGDRRGGFHLDLRDQRAGDGDAVEGLDALLVAAVVGLGEGQRRMGGDGGADRGAQQLAFHQMDSWLMAGGRWNPVGPVLFHERARPRGAATTHA